MAALIIQDLANNTQNTTIIYKQKTEVAGGHFPSNLFRLWYKRGPQQLPAPSEGRRTRDTTEETK